jgi:hypothetical protein
MKTPGASEVLTALGYPDAWKGKPKLWNEAMAAMPGGDLPFLDKSLLELKCIGAGISPELAKPLAGMADTIAADPTLGAFAWYMHWRIFVNPKGGVGWGAPSVDKRLGKREGLFGLLLSLEWPKRLFAYHRKLGYPAEVTIETIKEIACYVQMYTDGNGTPGMYLGQCAWLGKYLAEPFVRLGRFEYQMTGFDDGFTVFKRARDGAVIALAENGAGVDADGLRAGGKIKAVWTTRYKVDRTSFRGNPIDPRRGRILRKAVRLSRKEWKTVIKGGDTVANLHIPYGGGMDWWRVADSLQRTVAFFAKYHPRTPIKSVVLSTWFMDPRLADILPPDANPLRFQRACYLCPSWPQPGSIWFIFQRDVTKTPPNKLPAKTSIQRALIGFMKKGGVWHGGSMFVLPEDAATPREGAYGDRFARLASELGL